MKRRTFALGLATVSSISLAGCAGLNPFAEGGEDDLVGGGGGSSETDSGEPDGDSNESDDSSGESDTNSEPDPSDDSPDFNADTDTDSIVLRLSDLSDGYEYSGETDIVTAELDDNKREQYASDQIVRQHSRSFQRSNDEDGLGIIYSEATVYETARDVNSKLSDIISTFEDQSANITEIDLTTGVTATQIKYENDRGSKNVLLYYQQNNLILLVIASESDEFYPNRTEQLMITMISDVP